MQSRFATSEDENPFSLSVGDLMAGLLLFFILLLCAMLQKIGAQKEFPPVPPKLVSPKADTKQKIGSSIQKRLGGDKIDVSIGSESIMIYGRDVVFFDHGSSTLKSEGKDLLKEVVPQIAEILFKDFRNEIEQDDNLQVVVEGHASKTGGNWRSNLNLSVQRAEAVVDYVFGDNDDAMPTFDYKEDLREALSVSGRSFWEATGMDGASDDKDRKVVIRIRLKKSEDSKKI